LRFTGEDTVREGVHSREFRLDADGRSVPGLLWTPEGAHGRRPLVLIGHGASNSKRQDYVLVVAHRLVRRYGFAAAAIDGPVHGDRRTDGVGSGPQVFLGFAQAWMDDPAMTDTMVADWRATLDGLRELPEVGEGPTGFWGLSMGTILGLPLVAAEPRITVAVLGLMGSTGPTRERIVADAPRVTCPVLFLVQWDDELFPRESALELFASLDAPEKRLVANLGSHAAVPDDVFDDTIGFLARRLPWPD
jgi:dienelactone hydrolase